MDMFSCVTTDRRLECLFKPFARLNSIGLPHLTNLSEIGNTPAVSNMDSMFRQTDAFNQDINDWDISTRYQHEHDFWMGIPSPMETQFIQLLFFNQPVGDWNTSSAQRS